MFERHIFFNFRRWLTNIWLCRLRGIFKASALWADAFYKSKCPSVCLSVCTSVCLFTFEVPFNGLFAPTSRSRMSNIFRDSESLAPCIVPRVSGHPHSAQETTEMRSLHQSGRETKKFLILSSSRLCLKGWGSSSLDILQVCSCAEPGSSQLGTPVAKRCCRVFLEVYRVHRWWVRIR